MKVEIKLKDSDTCRDCPFVVIDTTFGKALCDKGIDLSKAVVRESTGAFVIVRPKKCKKKYGR